MNHTIKEIPNNKQIGLIDFLSKHKIISFPFMMAQGVYQNLHPNPRGLLLHINKQCNYDCIYCYINKKNQQSVSTQRWMEVIDQAKKLQVKYIQFLGGEPFLHKDFSRILRYTSQRRLDIMIFTNGSLIDDNWLRQLKALRLKSIIIKYDHKRTYKQHTNSTVPFKKIEGVIKKCIQNNIKVITFTTITRINIKYIKEILKSSLKLGAYPVFERFLPINNLKRSKKLCVSVKEFNYAITCYRNYFRNNIIMCKSIMQATICPCFLSEISILPDGSCVPCPFMPSNTAIGNIKFIQLKTIWNIYKKKREEWRKLPDECIRCRYTFVCRGGCKTHTWLKFRNFNRKDPLCAGFPPMYGYYNFYL